MNGMRQAILCALVVLAASGGVAAEDGDIRSLQAKLAAQEARLNELQARMGSAATRGHGAGAPSAILGIGKQASVTIGGLLKVRYWYNDAKITAWDSWGRLETASGQALTGWGGMTEKGNTGRQRLAAAGGDAAQQAARDTANAWQTKARARLGDYTMFDAKLRAKITVNDHFDAYVQVDLTSSSDSASDNAEMFWIRWKNIGGTGFGVKVGRDDLVFGQPGYGMAKSWAGGDTGGVGRVRAAPFRNFIGADSHDSLVFTSIPAHARWDIGRIMQATPYWEGLDGRFKWELSLMQKAHNDEWNQARADQNDFAYRDADSSYPYYKSKNYGWGTVSSRLVYKPVEGLALQASIANFYDKAPGTSHPGFAGGSLWGGAMPWRVGATTRGMGERWAKNNTNIGLGFRYRPAFMAKLLLWTQYIRGWNVDNLDGYDSDVVNFGFAYDFTEAFGVHAQGDYLRVKDGKRLDYGDGTFSSARKAAGWAGWCGVQYRLPYGASLEAGYKYETITFRNKTNFANYDAKRATVTGNTVFAQASFEF